MAEASGESSDHHRIDRRAGSGEGAGFGSLLVAASQRPSRESHSVVDDDADTADGGKDLPGGIGQDLPFAGVPIPTDAADDRLSLGAIAGKITATELAPAPAGTAAADLTDPSAPLRPKLDRMLGSAPHATGTSAPVIIPSTQTNGPQASSLSSGGSVVPMQEFAASAAGPGGLPTSPALEQLELAGSATASLASDAELATHVSSASLRLSTMATLRTMGHDPSSFSADRLDPPFVDDAAEGLLPGATRNSRRSLLGLNSDLSVQSAEQLRGTVPARAFASAIGDPLSTLPGTGSVSPPAGPVVAPSQTLSFEATMERLTEARQASTADSIRLSLAHREFGTIAVRLEPMAGDSAAQVTLTSADPSFAPAVQAALSERMANERQQPQEASPNSRTDQSGRADQGVNPDPSASHQKPDRHEPKEAGVLRDRHPEPNTSIDDAADVAEHANPAGRSGLYA